jgi:hypothetical protein
MSNYQVPNQTESIANIKAGYGGSVSSRPSFNRPGNVLFNTFSKALDLGLVGNIKGSFSGEIGSETGSNTHYYKINCIDSSDIRIVRSNISAQTDKYISVGLLDSNRKPVQLNAYGFGYNNEVINTEVQEQLLTLPKGVYYFTVSSSQWQTLPYNIEVQVIRYLELEGAILGRADLRTRVALIKMKAIAEGVNISTATLLPESKIKKPNGNVGGILNSYGLLAGLSGVAGGTFLTSGRMKITWRIDGAAIGSAPMSATLTASTTPSGGGGYP